MKNEILILLLIFRKIMNYYQFAPRLTFVDEYFPLYLIWICIHHGWFQLNHHGLMNRTFFYLFIMLTIYLRETVLYDIK